MDWYIKLVIVIAVVLTVVLYFIPWELPFDSNAEAFTLKMVKMHYYDALGCKIDAGYTFMVKVGRKDLIEGIDNKFLGGYTVTQEALRINRERIAERLNGE
jgi:hypothetical protein